MTHAKSRNWRRVVGWVAVALCASVGVLTWFGFRAVREWQRASVLLMQQRTDQAANMLAGVLTRDMQAVQRRVLSSADWVAYLDAPNELANLAATAFARYPYPDSFFAVGGALDPASMLFFARSDRLPQWAPTAAEQRRVPVTVLDHQRIAIPLIAAIREALSNDRRFSILEVQMAGTTYQVIAHLRYSEDLQGRLEGVLGFMVDLRWAREHYFDELTQQVARTTQAPPGVALSVIDDGGWEVTSARPPTAEAPVSARPFRVMFFDPLLVAAKSAEDLSWPAWQAQAVAVPEARLAAAMDGADRTILVAALAASTLVLGLVLMSRGVSTLEKVSALRAEFVATVTHELKTPIATIRAAGETLAAGRLSGPDDQREYAQMVVQESKHLTRLVDNLLALSRITDVTQVYWFESVDVHAVVEATLADFRQLLLAASCEARVSIPPDLPLVRADHRALRLMLDNLIDNAI
ncbi:MAG: hypothetical protein GEU74_17065, partial [Nitriliruptorales bacterium]|nr:hypothetical protein [Nitriliruptorales bacterium]